MIFVLLLAGAASAQEAPPPPIEPELALGSRLIDSRAEELVKTMSELLAVEERPRPPLTSTPRSSPAQKLEAFTVAVPFQVHVMTNVAVR